MRPNTRSGRKLRQAVKREVDLQRSTLRTVVLDGLTKLVVEVAGIDKTQERPLRIGIRENAPRSDLFSVFQYDPLDLAASNQHAPDRCTGTDLRAATSSAIGHGLRHCPHSAPGEPPQAAYSSDAAHVVMQQHVSRAG